MTDKPENTGDEKNKEAEDKVLKETSSKEVQPEVKEQDKSSQPSGLSDDQVTSIKDSISKDVTGKVSQEVSKSVIEKIGEALGLTKKQEDKLPTDAAELQKLVDQKLDEKFNQYKEQADKEDKEVETQRQTRINSTVQSWFTQYNQLAKLGKVPAMKEAKEGDAGYDARKKLILAIGKMIEQNKSQGVDYTPSISDVLVAFPDVLKGPPGADLPISGNTAVRENEAILDYKDLHGKSFEEIVNST